MVTLIVEQPSATALSVEQPTPATMSADEAIMVSVNDYEELRNKPSIAGVELTGNKSLDDLGAYTKAQVDNKLSAKANRSEIPSLEGYATEEWVEDKHYLTQHQSLANYYTKGQTNDLLDGKADANAIPSKTSDLTNDSGFITSVPVESVNSKTGAVSLTASDVGALPSSTAIPTKTSDLTNDSNFITLADLPIYNGSVS